MRVATTVIRIRYPRNFSNRRIDLWTRGVQFPHARRVCVSTLHSRRFAQRIPVAWRGAIPDPSKSGRQPRFDCFVFDADLRRSLQTVLKHPHSADRPPHDRSQTCGGYLTRAPAISSHQPQAIHAEAWTTAVPLWLMISETAPNDIAAAAHLSEAILWRVSFHDRGR